jgi:penicillin-binding protein 1A
LGEKETGAKAALPIWMAFMRAAIAGKDDERFLGDTPDTQTLKAPGERPGKPAPAKAAAKPPVKPALSLQPAPVKPQAIVKPAVNTDLGLEDGKDRR